MPRELMLAAILSGMAFGCGDDDASDAGRAGATAGASGRTEAGRGGRAGTGGSAGARPQAGSGGAGGSTRAVTITFKAKVGDRDFVCGQEYPDQGSSKLTATPRDFRFFVQDVQLVSADGEPVPLTLDERSPAQSKDVALIDFTPATGACFGSGTSENTTLTGTVPAGDTSYTGIRFVNAVPEALNHENLPKAKAPLQNALTHWGWQSGYRFIMAEIVSTSVDEDAGIPESTLVHIGSTACSGTVANGFTCSRPNRNQIELSGFDPTEHAIVADFEKVFERVDLGAGQQCHGPDPACKSMYDAFGVNLDTGAASDTQSVFRKE